MEYDFCGFSLKYDSMDNMAGDTDDGLSVGKDKSRSKRWHDGGDRLEPAEKRVSGDVGVQDPLGDMGVAPQVDTMSVLEQHGAMIRAMQSQFLQFRQQMDALNSKLMVAQVDVSCIRCFVSFPWREWSCLVISYGVRGEFCTPYSFPLSWWACLQQTWHGITNFGPPAYRLTLKCR